MFQVGDLVRYADINLGNDIPGIVLALVYDDKDCDDHIEVQWFDWKPGELARETPDLLIVLSSVRKEKTT